MLKALPAALYVAIVIIISGFCLVKWLVGVLRKTRVHPHYQQVRELEEEEEQPVIAQSYLTGRAIREARGSNLSTEDVRSVLWSTNLVDWHYWGQMVGWQITDPMTNSAMFFRWSTKGGAE